KAIRSALVQTLAVAEVLVCDDGSTDASREVVRAIADRRVRWVEGSRGGRPAIPRNRGIHESRGEWLAFLDDDDEWLPEKLERQLGLAGSLGTLAVSSNAFRIIPGMPRGKALLDWQGERLTFADILDTNRVICSSVLIHRSLIADVAGFPESPRLIACEDYALWLRVASRTDFAYVAEPLLNYRDDPVNSVRKAGPDEKSLRRDVLDDFTRWAAQSGLQGECRRAAVRHYRAMRLAGWRESCRALVFRFTREHD
ncbi:MAG: hypothetical protein A2091_02790, partial [Desulfuromonadales bacterium GWD2_61_12]